MQDIAPKEHKVQDKVHELNAQDPQAWLTSPALALSATTRQALAILFKAAGRLIEPRNFASQAKATLGFLWLFLCWRHRRVAVVTCASIPIAVWSSFKRFEETKVPAEQALVQAQSALDQASAAIANAQEDLSKLRIDCLQRTQSAKEQEERAELLMISAQGQMDAACEKQESKQASQDALEQARVQGMLRPS
jgi:hypothetical protein